MIIMVRAILTQLHIFTSDYRVYTALNKLHIIIRLWKLNDAMDILLTMHYY